MAPFSNFSLVMQMNQPGNDQGNETVGQTSSADQPIDRKAAVERLSAEIEAVELKMAEIPAANRHQWIVFVECLRAARRIMERPDRFASALSTRKEH